jgi:pimeloyl-ACP methyl ester carboxylesterase
VNLAYYVDGGGPPVLCIMGLGGRGTDWNPAFVGAMAPRFEMIRFDNRGTGGSDRPEEPYSLEVMADEAVGILDAVGRGRAHVVGVSMGGMIAQLVALRQPRCVDKLVLLSTTPGAAQTTPPSPAAMAALMPDMRKPREEIVRAAMQAVTAPGFADAHPEVIRDIVGTALNAVTPQFVFARQMAAIMASDRYADLPKITAPTVVIHGDADPLVPYANGEMLAGRIPGARLVTLHGCGHLAMWEQPAELTAILFDFLN